MDAMLFPNEAIAILRDARHDPLAMRGYNSQAGGFFWSDELVHRVREICANHDSRAKFYLLAYRASMIRGEPIEELRGPWEQLRQECPNWPGFRPERCNLQLARSLKRERTLERLFSAPTMILLAVPYLITLLVLSLCLPFGVSATAMNLEQKKFSTAFWLGLVLQVVGILFWSFVLKVIRWTFRSAAKWDEDARRGPEPIQTKLFEAILLFGVQFISLMPFVTMLDCGVHGRACSLVYLIYEIPALIVFVCRWKRWTQMEMFFLRWGWAPIISFGLPLLLPTLKAMGLVGGIN